MRTLNNNMSKLISIAFLILCACTAGLSAQAPPDFTVPDGIVGVPYYCACDFGLNAEFQQILSILAGTGITFSYDFKFTDGNLPPGLTVPTNAAITGPPTTARAFRFTAPLTLHV